MNEVILITGKQSHKKRLKELWKYREVITFLSWKDIIVRYKQTALGVLWAIFQPIFSMIIMTFVFGGLANMPSENGVPYAIMVYSALLPWNFFSAAFNGVSNSLVNNGHMIKKIYFPRLTLPISSVVTAFIDFVISLLVLLIIMVFTGYLPPIKILLFPCFIFLAFIIALGFGLFFSALNVKYRDIRYIVPVILQFGMYLSPVAYTSSVIPTNLRLVYSINPLVGVIEGFRWCIIPSVKIYVPALIFSIVIALIGLTLGVKFFIKFEDTFADVI
ncbi:ABC transporter permease [Clostridium sulfidigenes]|uniref:ABC transporter permease n=1 Tax=Clostridium sulfidigenes TaxID=318464 RepID=UPI003F8C9870